MSTEASTHGRLHPNLILAVIALAGLSYAMLSSAVIPALTTIQHDLHTTETGVTGATLPSRAKPKSKPQAGQPARYDLRPVGQRQEEQ